MIFSQKKVFVNDHAIAVLSTSWLVACNGAFNYKMLTEGATTFIRMTGKQICIRQNEIRFKSIQINDIQWYNIHWNDIKQNATQEIYPNWSEVVAKWQNTRLAIIWIYIHHNKIWQRSITRMVYTRMTLTIIKFARIHQNWIHVNESSQNKIYQKEIHWNNIQQIDNHHNQNNIK
jgi:hypothetical protein